MADSLPNQNAYIARDALLAASLRMYCLPPHDVGPLGKTHLIVAVPELLVTVVTQPQATAFLHLRREEALHLTPLHAGGGGSASWVGGMGGRGLLVMLTRLRRAALDCVGLLRSHQNTEVLIQRATEN